MPSSFTARHSTPRRSAIEKMKLGSSSILGPKGTKFILAVFLFPLSLMFAVYGLLLTMMGVAATFDEGNPIGILLLLWVILGFLGLFALWKCIGRFEWEGFVLKKKEKVFIGLGFLACLPFPYFIRWEEAGALGFILAHTPPTLAIALAVFFVYRSFRNSSNTQLNGQNKTRDQIASSRAAHD